LVRSDLRVCASGEPESEPKGTWSQTNPGCSAGREKMVTFFQRLGHRASENKGLRPRRDLKSCKTLRGFAAYAGMTLRPRIPTCRKKGQPEGNAIKSDTGRPRVARSYRKTCNAADQRNESGGWRFQAERRASAHLGVDARHSYWRRGDL
jgi:hypothetical protein